MWRNKYGFVGAEIWVAWCGLGGSFLFIEKPHPFSLSLLWLGAEKPWS